MFARMAKSNDLRGSGIDISRESVIPLSEAARYAGRLQGKKGVSMASMFRWAKKGTSGVRLELLYVGTRACTSKEALQRYFAAVTKVRECKDAPIVQEAVVPAPVSGRGDLDAILRQAGISCDEGAR